MYAAFIADATPVFLATGYRFPDTLAGLRWSASVAAPACWHTGTEQQLLLRREQRQGAAPRPSATDSVLKLQLCG